jgi:sensor histidine kinase YesM
MASPCAPPRAPSFSRGTPSRGFKSTLIKEINFILFLKEEHQNMKWKKDIPRSYLEEKWKTLLKMIQVYITCEGRYGRTMLYHFRLILHFTGKKPLNISFYLLKSITKMASKV